MQIVKIIFFGIAICISYGCATRPISNNDAKPIPQERIINSNFNNPTQTSIQVTLKRDKGFSGSACTSRIHINGIAIADLAAAEKLTVYLEEGNYIFSAWPNGICGGGMNETQAFISKKTPNIFRIGYGSNGDFSIMPTAF